MRWRVTIILCAILFLVGVFVGNRILEHYADQERRKVEERARLETCRIFPLHEDCR